MLCMPHTHMCLQTADCVLLSHTFFRSAASSAHSKLGRKSLRKKSSSALQYPFMMSVYWVESGGFVGLMGGRGAAASQGSAFKRMYGDTQVE